MFDVQVAVDERRLPRPQHRFRALPVASDDVALEHTAGQEPVALVGQPNREFIDAGPGPRR
jgi:hypothetical protein